MYDAEVIVTPTVKTTTDRYNGLASELRAKDRDKRQQNR